MHVCVCVIVYLCTSVFVGDKAPGCFCVCVCVRIYVFVYERICVFVHLCMCGWGGVVCTLWEHGGFEKLYVVSCSKVCAWHGTFYCRDMTRDVLLLAEWTPHAAHSTAVEHCTAKKKKMFTVLHAELYYRIYVRMYILMYKVLYYSTCRTEENATVECTRRVCTLEYTE